MKFQESVEKFCNDHGFFTETDEGRLQWSFAKQLSVVEDQWGMFCAWLREQHPVKVRIEVNGGVAYDMGNHPGAVVEIIDHD